MSFFISDAMAAAAPAAQAPSIANVIPILVIVLFFYLLLLRPQNKRAKEQKEMLAALVKGSEVVTTGGVLGRVADLDENFVSLEVAEGIVMQVQRHAIANLMPKGTFKAASKKAKTA